MLESRSLKRARTRAFVAALLVGGAVWLQAVSSAEALPQVIAQVATPTPFRFLTPTPFVPGKTTTSPITQPAPRAGGFPMELAFPTLAGGLAAIGGGAYLLRRKLAR
ncbi:MAG TPA: hypothetical protein VFG86_20220 [Chloroflexota bacterium]|jgi:hypothetical protein|nr:hypothetical protein [Chloroflexota bacterium]